MTESTRQRLFGFQAALDHPVTLWIAAALAAVLVLAPVAILAMDRAGRISGPMRKELWARYFTWLMLVPLMVLPVSAGAAWTIGAVTVLSLLCYFEFARNTPLAGERAINTVAVIGILAVNFAALDHWAQFFSAVGPLTLVLIAVVTIWEDRPEGYLQRVALGMLGFGLFGTGLAYLSYTANDPNYRPLILTVLLCVALNDVFAFLCGKALGRRKLVPNTSPGKTMGGAIGALVLTSLLGAALARSLYAGTPLDHPLLLLAFGAMISVLGQLGDLMISSIKRDLGVKDMGVALPGHGGILDRFDSLILVAPAVFYLVGHFVGLGLEEPVRIFTS